MNNVTDWYQAEDAEPRRWYSVQNQAGTKSAAVEIYDDIIPFVGVNAADFRNDITALGDDIDTINLHIHSRGGNVYEAVAIMNTLRQHDATVVTTVDSIAASAAGFIAVGASDELIVAENAELMAHLPWAVAVGDAADMRKQADRLDQIGNNIASIFAERAGGTVDEWLQILTDETWWSAQEAVDAGIADKVLKAPKKKAAANGDGTKNRLDLSVFNHAGRSQAPAPRMSLVHNKTPQPSEAEETEGKEPTVASLNESLAQKLGLDAEANDEAILAAVDVLAEHRPETENEPDQEAQAAEPTVAQVRAFAENLGLEVVNKVAHDQLQADVNALKEMRAQQVRALDEQTIQNALESGKITPSSSQSWRDQLAKDRDGISNLLASMPENRALAIAGVGHGVAAEDTIDAEMVSVYNRVTGTNFGKDS